MGLLSWHITGGVLALTLDAVYTTAVATLLYVLGVYLRRRVNFLTRFCIPYAVIGGLIMALITLALHHAGGGVVKFNTVMQSPMMIAFFTTVGIGGSLKLLKRGGGALIVYLVACWLLAVFQNGFGAGLAKILGIQPLLGIMAGAVSLEGGHGAAAAFGPTAESLGVAGAGVVAIASATYGLIAGGLIGGPIASWLITKNQLEIKAVQDELFKNTQDLTESAGLNDSFDMFRMITLVIVIMALGGTASDWFNGMARNVWGWKNFSLPGYVSAMFVAIIFRNLNDSFKVVKLHDKALGIISDVSIGLFLTMAMMSIRIWELYELAVPLIVILVLQTAAIALIAVYILFPALGKDYDAAVMCSGFCGHGLGATPNAVSNMGAVSDKYGMMSYKAFLIVPLCGAVLIDIVAIPCIVWFINYFAP